jgi:hypothetical protein
MKMQCVVIEVGNEFENVIQITTILQRINPYHRTFLAIRTNFFWTFTKTEKFFLSFKRGIQILSNVFQRLNINNKEV